MSVAAEGDGDVQAVRDAEELFAWIDFLAGFAQTSRAHFNRGVGFGDGAQRILEHLRKISLGSEIEFLRQIGMGKGIEQARPGGLRPYVEILSPAEVYVLGLPVLRAAVDREIAEAMHAAEEEVPRVHRGQFADPF